MNEPAKIACPYSEGTLEPPPPTDEMTPCVRRGLELPATHNRSKAAKDLWTWLDVPIPHPNRR